ncbi:MAG TPA: NADH-quinone oxidoreductase subunit C [Opitutaceae bacterium]|nr:NADH-quinone oxidoreductase subunit C [Opitutaceae bacterium]
MTAAAELTTALGAQWPGITERPSLDHPAFDVPLDSLVAVLRHLRDSQGYDFLADITAVDWKDRTPRFTVVYHLFSTTHHNYVRIAADCAGDTVNPEAPSIVELWPGANWHERECFDMMGVKFLGHPDLRRILMWDGYPYFPLRKEFPLAGIETVLPDDEIAAVTGEPVRPAPMAGGPFVATPGLLVSENEPRAKDESWNERKAKPDA